jgi:hypothetical protein
VKSSRLGIVISADFSLQDIPHDLRRYISTCSPAQHNWGAFQALQRADNKEVCRGEASGFHHIYYHTLYDK